MDDELGEEFSVEAHVARDAEKTAAYLHGKKNNPVVESI